MYVHVIPGEIMETQMAPEIPSWVNPFSILCKNPFSLPSQVSKYTALN